MKNCKKCGAELVDGTKFCSMCGAPWEEFVESNGAANADQPKETVGNNGQPVQPQFNQPQHGQQYSQPQYTQPQYGQPQYTQPQYYQPAPQYYQQPVYAPQPVYVQPPQPKDPRDALLKAAKSSKFAVGMWFHIAAFIMTVAGIIMVAALGAGLSSAYGVSQIYDSLTSSGNDGVAAFLSGPALSVILIIACVPLIMLTAGVIITYIGAKKENKTVIKIGMIFIMIMLSLILLALVALPLFLLFAASTGTVMTSWLRAILIIWLACEIFCLLPLILTGIKALRILKGTNFEKYTLPVVPVALILMGVFVLISSIGFFIILQWVAALGVICLGVSCFIFASVVIGYNKDAKYAIKQY